MGKLDGKIEDYKRESPCLAYHWMGWDILSGTGVTTALKIIVHTIMISITLEEEKHYPFLGTFLGTLQNLMKG